MKKNVKWMKQCYYNDYNALNKTIQYSYNADNAQNNTKQSSQQYENV